MNVKYPHKGKQLIVLLPLQFCEKVKLLLKLERTDLLKQDQKSNKLMTIDSVLKSTHNSVKLNVNKTILQYLANYHKLSQNII